MTPAMPPPEHAPVADAPRGNWVDRFLPPSWRPYARLARLDRPIGWWLLLWPCWWSSALAAGAAGWAWPNPWHLFLFLVGAIAMRGAGCTYNDIVDRDFDAMVARTRSRPIPSGQVTVAQARLFLLIQALVGLIVLVQFDLFTILLGILSLLVVAIYPFMKRFTDWPQIGLGLAFSWGALMGWAAVFEGLSPAAYFLYAGAIAWTIGYDTIYAHQDKEDDAIVGVRSTARLLGDRTRGFLAGFYVAATIFFAAAFAYAGAGIVAWLGLGFGAVHLAWQVATLDIDDPDRCLKLFKSNRDYGWILFAGIVIDTAIRAL
jgi:4-hydroxybenzoate polyprenyltransferase